MTIVKAKPTKMHIMIYRLFGNMTIVKAKPTMIDYVIYSIFGQMTIVKYMKQYNRMTYQQYLKQCRLTYQQYMMQYNRPTSGT